MLPREVVNTSSLEAFKVRLDKAADIPIHYRGPGVDNISGFLPNQMILQFHYSIFKWREK